MTNEPTRIVRADLHNHLRTSSYWRRGDFNRAVDVAQRRLGAGGITGLINFSDKRFETFAELPGYERTFVGESQNAIYVPQKDILIAKGQEIPTQQGHLLVLGLPKDVHLKDWGDLENTMKEARKNGGSNVADHLFSRSGIGPHIQEKLELFEQLDAIEVFNGEADLWFPGLMPRNANPKALRFYQGYNPSGVGALTTGDGHSFDEVGRCWTALDAQRNYERFDTKRFRQAVKSAPASPEYSMQSYHKLDGYPAFGPVSVRQRRNPLKLEALTHIALLGALVCGAKISQPVRSLVGIEKYYDIPRPVT